LEELPEVAMALSLHLLVLEDQPADAELAVYELRQSGFELDWQRVDTEADYLAHLNPNIDLILADYSLPDIDAQRALHLLKHSGFDIPFIVVTGTVTEEAIIEIMKQGAADYLLKDRMTRLGQAVTHVLQEKRLRVENQRAETALRENEARLLRLTENAQDIVYRYRLIPTQSLEYVNPAVTAITGYTPAECYANPGLLFNLIHEDDEPLLQQLFAESDDPTLSVTIRLVRKDGSICWVEQRAVLIRDKEGNLVAIEGIARDITERKRAEAERLNAELLRTELEKEKELIVLRERFISMVGHDFRTPLAVIQACSDLLGRYFERISPEKRLKFLQDIQVQIGFMIQLLDDLQVVDRARSGKLKPELTPLDVVSFAREILDQVQLTDEVGHQFVFLTKGNVDRILTDENLLRRILLNLLSNALKYSPGGSEIQFEVSAESGEVLLRVSDQGIGIPAADQERLFEVFHRASNTGKVTGTGLGLAIVKSSVDALGGTITFSSQQGQGTTFSVHLPTSSFSP
jgi:PAS domain S-box-containing protein